MQQGPPDEDSRLISEAVGLVIRLQDAPDNPIANDMVRAWRARSPKHEDAWRRVATVHSAAGNVMRSDLRAPARAGPVLSRRRLMIGGAIGATAAVSSAFFVPELLILSRADYGTGKGEIRRVVLPDSSIATLGPDSAIALNYTPAQRSLQLLSGMCFFEVAKDPSRPFTVVCDGVAATALGTAFDISSDAGIVTVGVDHGTVQTAPSRAFASGDSQLKAGDWIAYDGQAATMEQGRLDAGDIGAWRDRRIVADRETVYALVARIARWIPGRVVMADPYIGAKKVSGVFDLSTPQHALSTVVLPAGGRVRQISSFLTVVTPI